MSQYLHHLRAALFAASIVAATVSMAHRVGAAPPVPKALDGRVIEIISGDLFVIVADGSKHRIRLLGADAPEEKQPYFDDAFRVLSGKVLSRKVHVDVTGGEKSSGYLGRVTLGGQSINRAMVAEGAAWHDSKQAPSTALAKSQQSAQEQKLGLWAGEAPQSPWEFRGHQPDSKSIAAEKQRTRAAEAVKVAVEFLKGWQAGESADGWLTKKGKEIASEEKKKAPSSLAGVEIKPGEAALEGRSASVPFKLLRGDSNVRGRVRLKSEDLAWKVVAVEAGVPASVLDFENQRSMPEKLASAIDDGLDPAMNNADEMADADVAPGGDERGSHGNDPAMKGGGATDDVAIEESAEGVIEAEPEPQPAADVANEQILAPATPAAPVRPRRSGLAGKVRDAQGLDKEHSSGEESGDEEAPKDDPQEPVAESAAETPLDPEIEKALRGFLKAWVNQDPAEMETYCTSTADEITQQLPPANPDDPLVTAETVAMRRLKVGEEYAHTSGEVLTVRESEANDEQVIVSVSSAAGPDPRPFQMVKREDTWRVDYQEFVQRTAPPPAEEFKSPKPGRK